MQELNFPLQVALLTAGEPQERGIYINVRVLLKGISEGQSLAAGYPLTIQEGDNTRRDNTQHKSLEQKVKNWMLRRIW